MSAVVQLERPRIYVDADDVAEYLGVTASWIYDLAKAGKIPHYRIGRRIKFRLEEIDRWMAGRHQGPEV